MSYHYSFASTTTMADRSYEIANSLRKAEANADAIKEALVLAHCQSLVQEYGLESVRKAETLNDLRKGRRPLIYKTFY